MIKPLLISLCAMALGLVLGLTLQGAAVKHLRRRNQELRAAIIRTGEPSGPAPFSAPLELSREEGQMKPETTKRVIWVCLMNGFAWVWCSYLLAYMDKVQIAESLSQVAVTEIIGVVLAYCIKSAVENLSKNNRWPDKDSGTHGAPEDREPPGVG